MHRLYRTGIHLGLFIVGIAGSTTGWSADQPQLNQATDASSVSNEQQAVQKQSSPSSTTSGVIPAGYVAPSQWRDQTVDQLEMRRRPGIHRAPLFVVRTPAKATAHTYHKVSNKTHEIKDWFCYIKGNGPAIWVPKDMCRPQGH